MIGETLTEMAEKEGVPQRTIERRIQRAGIRPITREALYPVGTYEKVKDAKVGRPRLKEKPVIKKKKNSRTK